MDDADGEPGVLIVEPALEAPVAQPQMSAIAVPFDPQVGVRDPEFAGARQRGIGEGLRSGRSRKDWSISRSGIAPATSGSCAAHRRHP